MAERETEYVEVEIDRILAVTAKALLISYDRGEELWVPKSVVEDSDTYIRGEYDFIMVADWFARKEGLI